MDASLLKNKGIAKSKLSENELNRRAQELLSGVIHDANYSPIQKEIQFRHDVIYCLLLKMAQIQLKEGGSEKFSKINSFVEFMHENISAIFMRETVIAMEYFKKGQNLRFFGKIQKNRDDVLDNLKNMAWDLWHLRQSEEALTFRPDINARYFFPAFLTLDNRLIEILKLYSLKACAIPPEGNKPIPFHDGDFAADVKAYCKDGEQILLKYFTEMARKERERRRKVDKDQIYALISELEKDVLSVAEVLEPAL